MALINCPECNKEISDKAASCPNCGFPIQEINKPKFSPTGMNICPKCGTTNGKFFDWDNYVADKCPYCKTEMLDCHTSTDEYENMSVDEQWLWRQEMYNKYVKNSPEFDESLFSKTFQERETKYEEEKEKQNNRSSIPTKPSEPKITCPYCHRTNTYRISSMAKAANIAMFGIFGNKRKYQWHCNNCNSDF